MKELNILCVSQCLLCVPLCNFFKNFHRGSQRFTDIHRGV